MITRIHHVAIAVHDLDAGLAFWCDTLELPVLRSADLQDQGVRAALLSCGSGELELIAPLGPDTGVGRFLQTFKAFPPRQKPASFSIDQVLEQLQNASAAAANR